MVGPSVIPARLGGELNNPNVNMIIQYLHKCWCSHTQSDKVLPSFTLALTSCDSAAAQFNLCIFKSVCCSSLKLLATAELSAHLENRASYCLVKWPDHGQTVSSCLLHSRSH